jgi:hypothetical protein
MKYFKVDEKSVFTVEFKQIKGKWMFKQNFKISKNVW